jgi:hypothetical protein
MINKRVFKKLLPDNTKKWTIFSVCILTATVFWVFLTFSKSFEYSLDFNLEYSGKPTDKILVNDPITQVKVRVKGQGFDLFNYTLMDKKKVITVDVSRFSKTQNSSMTIYTLNLSKEGNDLFGDKNSELKAVAYSVDTLKLVFDEVVSKKLLIDPVVKVEVDSLRYAIDGFQVVPDSILVTGSKFLLKSMDVIKTELTQIRSSATKTKFTLAVQKPSGVLKLAFDSVQYNLNLLNYESRTVSVPVLCKNCPDSVNVKLFPSYADVSFVATTKSFEKMTAASFLLLVDYQEIENGSEKIFIKLAKYPDGLRQLKLSPAKAEYLLRANN